MRVILKPGAVAVLLATLVSLTVLALWRYNSGGDRPVPSSATTETTPAPINSPASLLSQKFFDIQYVADAKAGRLTEIAVTVAAGGNTKALRAEVTRAMKNAWDAQAGMLAAEPIASGEYLTASVWARSPTRSQTTVGFEQSKPPYENIATKEFILTPEWAEYRFDFASTRAFKAGEASVKMRLAHKPGVIELTGMRLTRKAAP